MYVVAVVAVVVFDDVDVAVALTVVLYVCLVYFTCADSTATEGLIIVRC
jgi:hypothetical protein